MQTKVEKSTKLEFNKEQVVNLNDQDLQQINGGVAPSSAACVISIVDIIVNITIAVVTNDGPAEDWKDVSKRLIDIGEGENQTKACYLDEVEIIGLKL